MTELTPEQKARMSLERKDKLGTTNSNAAKARQEKSPRDEWLARTAEYLEISKLTPAELAARHDPEVARQQLRQIFEAADFGAENTNTSKQEYFDVGGEDNDHKENSFFEIEIEDNDENTRAVIKPSELNLVEVAGIIKWFDAAKGYGFIVPDKNLPDILLPVKALRSGGYQVAYEGARIFAQCVQKPRGWQVFRILSMDNSYGIHPSQLPERLAHVVKAESGWESAVVKWFNRVRGFGILSSIPFNRDIFIHINTIRRYGFSELRPGQMLEVRWGNGNKGPTVAEMRPEKVIGRIPFTH